MAFLRFAKCHIVKPNLHVNAWRNVRTASTQKTDLRPNLIEQASDIFHKPFSPSDYLLTHATIIASVDTEEVPNVKLGAVVEDGVQIERKYANYRIVTGTEKWINNNNDSWDRPVLLKAYPTFIGGHNFCFAPGTLILMENGSYKPIRDIEVGDQVVSHTGKVRRVVRLFERPFQGDLQAIKINHHKEPILVTGNHPFRAISTVVPPLKVREGTRVSNAIRYRNDQVVKALRGDAHSLGIGFSASRDWVNAEYLRRGDFLLGPEQVAGSQADQDLAVLLGYYLAEGCTSTDQRSLYFCFGPHEQRLVDHTLDCLGRAFPKTNPRVYKTQTTLKVAVHSKEATVWFVRHGSRLAHGKRISSEVLSWDQESLLCMAAAWISGDGDYHKQTQRLRGITVSQDLAHQMRFVFEKCGIKTSATRTKIQKGVVQGTVSLAVGSEIRTYDVIPRHDVWTVTVSKENVPAVMSMSKRWFAFPLPSKKRADFAWWGGQRTYCVSSNTPIPYDGSVYNFEVEEDHSYVVAPGIAVHNCEHVQIEDLSKGRIVDAVARDIGESVYVDILIATDKQHRDLVAAILADRMSTLSMGCSIDESTCTRCGHVAADETQMCRHIKYEKGNHFFDRSGVRRKIAELCGHHSVDPHGGVQFIEASWVETPAFTGAVLRNVIDPEDATPEITKKAEEVLATPPKEWAKDKQLKAAQQLRTGQFDLGDKEDGDDGGEEESKPEKTPLDDLEEDIQRHILVRVKKKLKDQMVSESDKAKLSPENSSLGLNNTIIKEAIFNERRASYRAAMNALVKTATSDVALIDRIAQYNQEVGVRIPIEIYRAVVAAGPTDRRETIKDYLRRCKVAAKREFTLPECRTLIRLGKLLEARTRFLQNPH